MSRKQIPEKLRALDRIMGAFEAYEQFYLPEARADLVEAVRREYESLFRPKPKRQPAPGGAGKREE